MICMKEKFLIKKGIIPFYRLTFRMVIKENFMRLVLGINPCLLNHYLSYSIIYNDSIF